MKIINNKQEDKEKKFYEMDLQQRFRFLKRVTKLSKHDIDILRSPSSFTFVNANRMVENAIGVLSLPLGIATNFVINNQNYLVPMAIEEPSVIAAASNAAKIASNSGGFTAKCYDSLMIGQVQVVSLPISLASARLKIKAHKKEILRIANSKSSSVLAKNLQV